MPTFRKVLSRCILCLLLGTVTASIAGGQETEARPNIVLILADDMGYGDVGAYNEASKIPTPNIDRLADEGRRFVDAHAAGSVCVPSRYGLLTGRYPLRIHARSWRERALIEPNEPTIATVLKEEGYYTGMVGKWHLGFEGGDNYDCTAPLMGGPVDHGFDAYFGQPASLDQPPYFFIRNRSCVVAPTETTLGGQQLKAYRKGVQGPFWRAGHIAPGFKHENVLPRWREEAIRFLEAQRRRENDGPFFLYLALTAPHTPWLPSEEFRGASRAGLYGDFAVQVDDLVGSVVSTLERLGVADNTLVIFTSDNGPLWYDSDERRLDHRSAYIYRGMKGDIWEGGHRIPFIARWPGHVPARTVSEETIMFTDMLATFSALLGKEKPDGAGEDSYDVLPALLDASQEEPVRDVMIHTGGYRAVRSGPWKLIRGLGSGGRTEPQRRDPEPGGPEGQLYNLTEDPGERNNLYLEHPDVVERLSKLLAPYEQAAVDL